MMLKSNGRLFIKSLISLFLLGWLLHSIDWKSLQGVFLNIQPWWLFVSVLAVIISMIVSTAKWSIILRAQGIILPCYFLWKAYWTGIFFNNFLPSSIGGDGMRIFIAGRTISNIPVATSSVVIERILATAGLAAAGLLGSCIIRNPGREICFLFLILMIISHALLAFLLWGKIPDPVKGEKSDSEVGKRKLIEGIRGTITIFIRQFLAHSRIGKGQAKKLLGAGILSFIFQLTVVGVNYAIFRAIGITGISWWDMVYVIPAISAASMIPLGINGYGIREGAYVLLLASYGVTKGAALGVSLLFALVVSFCSLYGGYIWLGYEGRGFSGDGFARDKC